MHLSNAFRKLDIPTRAELPRALAPSPQARFGTPAD
jgi:DNA-binding CsgD family transcriptional regulator